MPRTCLAGSSSERVAIDKALVAGEPLRHIAKRVSISPAGLLRDKNHVAGAIAKAQERREGKLGDSIFDEIRRLQRKALELLGKMESEGDYRGAIVAAREAREYLESQSALLARAESRSAPKVSILVNPYIDRLKRDSASEPEGPGVKGPGRD